MRDHFRSLPSSKVLVPSIGKQGEGEGERVSLPLLCQVRRQTSSHTVAPKGMDVEILLKIGS